MNNKEQKAELHTDAGIAQNAVLNEVPKLHTADKKYEAFCPTCNVALHGAQVTYDERHWYCNTPVEWHSYS